MWHEATKDLQEAGSIRMMGIIQEQHPDRARLFMQWKQIDWPVMVDALNQLQVAVVPLTILIDEHGIVRVINPPRQQINEVVQDFIGREFDPPDSVVRSESASPDLKSLRATTANGSALAWLQYGQALVNRNDPGRSDDAVDALSRAAALSPDNGWIQFQLGVAYRRRHDSSDRQPGDFQRAVEHWCAALEINPNQYIWRRRIQQFGPRLEKPYPFYDWVTAARTEIRERGETPWPLVAEPTETELAGPAKSLSGADEAVEEPDRAGRVLRDDRGFVQIESTVVPAAIEPGGAVRVHIRLEPNERTKAHWNNEAEDLKVWISPPTGWVLDSKSPAWAPPPEDISREARILEFELKAPGDASPGTIAIPAYALYNVCEDVDGACLYRRQDMEIHVEIK